MVFVMQIMQIKGFISFLIDAIGINISFSVCIFLSFSGIEIIGLILFPQNEKYFTQQEQDILLMQLRK